MVLESKHVHATRLAGVDGRLRIELADQPGGPTIVEVHDGDVTIHEGDGAADAVVKCQSKDTVLAIQRGTLNPVVAALQNELAISGDLAFAIEVILSLHGTAP